MLAVSGPLPVGEDWTYELKWDGVRAIGVIRDGRLRLYARSGAEITAAYPELAGLAAAVATDATLDGEIVALDAAGRPSFAELSERIHVRDRDRAAQLAATAPVTFMIFDLLALAGEDFTESGTAAPYRRRRAALEQLAPAGSHWLVPPQFEDGAATLDAANEHSLEGVVAKRLGSIYRPGARSPDWVKVKRDETGDFVIGGWRPGERRLGALLVGSPTAGGGLEYRGRVGGGISGAAERSLLAALSPLRADDSPFTEPLPRVDAKDATWVRPELVVEVRYGQRTRDGRLRFPRFLRLRPDKSPADCEPPQPPPAGPDDADVGGPPAEPAGPPAESGEPDESLAAGSVRPTGSAAASGESATAVRVDGRTLELSNLDKVLYPATGFTKGEVIDYYARVAPVLLPYLRDRALTRLRFPNGVSEASFFEKNAPAGTPRWVRTETLPVPGSSTGRETLDFVVAEDLPTLVWLANLAALELHTPQWKIGGGGPDLLVVDLDPGPPAGLAECARVALTLRDRLAADGLTAVAKTSGKKGMQLYCPIAGSQSSEVVSGYVKDVAEELARADPRGVTAQMAKRLRPGKVFIDWSQNAAAKTTVSPYSLRAEPTPSVSTPLTWDEVAAGEVGRYSPEQVLARLEQHGDLLAPLLDGGPPVP